MGRARLGSFEDLIAQSSPQVRAIAAALRDVVLELHPDTTEVVRLGDGAATYGLGPRKMVEGYAYLMPRSDWVNLGFYQAAALPDPTGLLEGTGARMRHVKVRSLDKARAAEIKALVAEAIAERRDALRPR
jgi:hypothetical protein